MPAPRLWTWRRLAAVTLAKALLSGLVGLAIWGALPALIGWHPTTVSSGSMMPRLHVGDVAVSRPLGTHVPPLSSVLLFDDPDHPGRLRMHRFVRIDDDGLLVTRGDANPADDSTPVSLGAVRGIGTLRVPWIALPIIWLREGRWPLLGLAAGGLVLVLVVASSGRDRTFDDDDPSDTPPAVPDLGEAGPLTRPAARARHSWRPSLRRAVRSATAVLGAGLLALPLAASPAEARFTGTTTSTGDLTAAAFFSCENAVTAFGPTLWYRMDETYAYTTTATDSSGNGSSGSYGYQGKTPTSSQACVRDTGGGMTFDGSSGYLNSPALTGGMPDVFTLSIWFRTTTTRGGKLIGFGSSRTGASSNYDRHIYMTNTGRLLFGVYPGAVKTVSSTAAYNDNKWHLAAASLSAAGMRLYVDGDLVASDASTTAGEPGTTAYLRVAFDNLDGWTSVPTSRYFAGTLDDAAYFSAALTARQVSRLYEAGTP